MAKIDKTETQETQVLPARIEAGQPAPAVNEKTPEQALNEDWKAKHHQLAQYITQKGKMRGGLKPSDQAKAHEILNKYGFQIA